MLVSDFLSSTLSWWHSLTASLSVCSAGCLPWPEQTSAAVSLAEMNTGVISSCQQLRIMLPRALCTCLWVRTQCVSIYTRVRVRLAPSDGDNFSKCWHQSRSSSASMVQCLRPLAVPVRPFPAVLEWRRGPHCAFCLHFTTINQFMRSLTTWIPSFAYFPTHLSVFYTCFEGVLRVFWVRVLPNHTLCRHSPTLCVPFTHSGGPY